jgi:hypothetical protein
MNERWTIGLCITPFKLWGFPAKSAITFDQAASNAIKKMQKRLAASGFAVATEYDGGFPKLLIDHWGFSLQVKPGARSLTGTAGTAGILDASDLDSIKEICARIPPTAHKRQKRRGRF